MAPAARLITEAGTGSTVGGQVYTLSHMQDMSQVTLCAACMGNHHL
jgi:hypothetical protein